MTESIAVTRALIACEIYLKLFDAGEEGATFATGVTMGTGFGGGEDIEQIRTVMERLREAGAVQGIDAAHPGINVLGPDQRDRMVRQMPGVGNYADRLRADLAAHARGEQVNPGVFIKTEAAIRTGYSDAAPL